MSFTVNFPLFMIVLSLMSAAVSSVLPGKVARVITLCLNAVVCTASSILTVYLYAEGPVFYKMGHFPSPWGNELKLTYLGSLFAAIFATVMFLCVLGGKKHINLDIEAKKQNFYYIMIDLIQAALLVFCFTNDIFTGYVFIEICTIASCGILMISQIGRTTLAAVRYMIFSLVGSGLFLLGVVVLYNITGHLLMPQLRETVEALWQSGEYRMPLISSLCLIVSGLAIKSGLFPFQFWMPDTYGYATPASSGILSGLVSKGYIFFLIKIILDVYGSDMFYSSGMNNVLFALGVIGIVTGSGFAIAENNIFRMIAQSSAAQIGYIYMGIGISPTLGIVAALFHIITHAITKPSLFLSASALSDSANGYKKFRNLQGVAKDNKPAGIFFTIGAFSMIGIPFTMGFVSKYLFATAGLGEGSGFKAYTTIIVLAVSTILNTLYFARTVIRIYSKPTGEDRIKLTVRNQKPYVTASVIFAIINIGTSLAASPIFYLIERGVSRL